MPNIETTEAACGRMGQRLIRLAAVLHFAGRALEEGDLDLQADLEKVTEGALEVMREIAAMPKGATDGLCDLCWGESEAEDG